MPFLIPYSSQPLGVSAPRGSRPQQCRPAPSLRYLPLPLPPAPRTTPFELEEATIAGLQEGMRTGKYISRHLCELYLARIDTIDRRGPTPLPALRAVIETNPDALAIAAQRDEERKTGKLRGPL